MVSELYFKKEQKVDFLRNQRRLLLSVLVWAFSFFDIFGLKAETGVKNSLPKRIRMVSAPFVGVKETEDKLKPLSNHLEKSLGTKIDFRVCKNILEMIEGFRDNQIELGYMGPFAYIEVNRLSGAEVIALELSPEGKPGYYAIIISSKRSGIKNLEQARGKVFAFPDADSTSGFLVPNVYFLKERKEPISNFASRTALAGSHLEVVKGVGNGSYDVGATNDIDFIRAIKILGTSQAQFNILWRSKLIPGSPIVVKKGLPESLKQAILNALLEFNQDKVALEKMGTGGFARGKDSDFNLIRDLENYLKH